jgi:hypothetical protein
LSEELSYRRAREVLSLLDSSKKIYKNYLSCGRKFLYAKELRSINEQILNLINNQKVQRDKVLESALQNLKKHLEEWIYIWDKEKNTRSLNDSNEFIFCGYKTYPKYLDQLLISYLEKITGSEAG